jgi:steroid delta-isomerase-like uncharacterized protein
MNASALLDAWNSRSAEAVAALYAGDGVRQPFAFPEAPAVGRAAIAEAVGMAFHAVPDAGLIHRGYYTTTEGLIVVEWTFSGTLENDYGPLPGTGGSLTLPGSSVMSTRSDGLIQHESVYWDTATLMVVAGMIPAMA